MKKYMTYIIWVFVLTLPILTILTHRAGMSKRTSEDVVLSFARSLKVIETARKKITADRIGRYFQKNDFPYLIKGDGYQFSGNLTDSYKKILFKCIKSIEKKDGELIYKNGRARCFEISRISIAWIERGKTGLSISSILLFLISLIPALILGWFFYQERSKSKYLKILAHKARQMARGTLPRLDRYTGVSQELVEITDAFAVMTASLYEAQQMLEEKVEEVENQKLKLELHQNQIIAREKLVSIGEMAAGVAHEIGNPVAALMGMRDLLEDENCDEEKKYTLSLMKEELERIHSLIQRMMDVLSPAGQDTSESYLKDILNNATEISSHHKALREVEFKLEKIPEDILVNQLVLQVFLNLFINSGNAMNGKGQITVSFDKTTDTALVTVKDTGPGVKEEDMQRIFEPFYTGKLTADSHGLGLSTSLMIMSKAGGAIRCVKSDAGAKFILEFPLKSRPLPA
ncbi:HAMP domain-containing histidine kinase [Myxococcota bacterium]|nr:HAMP domain-containing histidine kinase [Myxococcota bacterium]MBU1382485.1 HAMP domain-containing histidine kinase [Myxococcota bacterium]MBU1497953.1 HAMP domain-containing histidine kinase [Myxococcota bacterium]